VNNRETTKPSRKIILFGAGKNGKEALKRYGKDNVAFFCDNDKNKIGKMIEGVEIISFEELKKVYYKSYVIIITLASPCFVIGQLENAGIKDYLLYHDVKPRIVDYSVQDDIYVNEHNEFLRNLFRKSYENDLLESIDNFSVLVKEALELSREKGIPLNYITKGDEEEGYRYGNLQTLARYAGIEVIDGVYAPVVSHVHSVPIFSPIFRYKTAVIMSGEYYKDKIHERAPWVPVFTVGSYINYANEIYNSAVMNEKKKNIGSMLLVFLPHTLEDANRDYNRKSFIDEVLKQYRNLYDQVWLCVYFADINDDICDYAKNRGVHVVSAGFRFDPLFNDRLKTIIQLCDGVVCGDIGGFLAYAMCLNKPIARVEIDKKESLLDVQYKNEIVRNIEKTKDYMRFEEEFYCFFDNTIKLDEKMKKWMDPVAGFSLCKEKEYIKRIFEISGEIWDMSCGNYRDYPDSVRRVYYKYDAEDDYEKMYILRQAVGSFLD